MRCGGHSSRRCHRSRWFLLLASPQAAGSPWVSREVEWWLEHASSHQLLLALTDGEIAWDAATGDFDRALTTAVPEPLYRVFDEEPKWIDLRWADSPERLGAAPPPIPQLHRRPRSADSRRIEGSARGRGRASAAAAGPLAQCHDRRPGGAHGGGVRPHDRRIESTQHRPQGAGRRNVTTTGRGLRQLAVDPAGVGVARRLAEHQPPAHRRGLGGGAECSQPADAHFTTARRPRQRNLRHGDEPERKAGGHERRQR